ncbi:hypothetical protein [Aquihabitans sp. McL0605]|uniref:hypothetical protein n=1 Tax=Aquihabitans sp. McL0605 TaxID=3415671 RepID=UPI003CF902B0
MDPADHTAALPLPASRHALALLRFPDPRTDWVVVTVATLSQPLTDLDAALEALHASVPIVGARLRDEVWHAGSAPTPIVVEGDPLGHPALDRAFDLGEEPPLRVVLSADGLRLGIAGHHAAFDGLALVAVLRALTSGEQPKPVTSPPPGEAGSKVPLLQRLARPADRVAPTPGVWPRDAYATRTVTVTGKGITGQLTAACVRAVVDHNADRDHPIRKVGLTIAIGGPAGVGNVASYRRIDVTPSDPIPALVQEALASPDEPGEQVSAPKALMALLEPVVERFSDTILVSNLGRHRVPGVERLDFFPVARGRSAVCFASAAIEGGQTTLTLRARDLSPGDARRLLDAACAHLASSPG